MTERLAVGVFDHDLAPGGALAGAARDERVEREPPEIGAHHGAIRSVGAGLAELRQGDPNRHVMRSGERGPVGVPIRQVAEHDDASVDLGQGGDQAARQDHRPLEICGPIARGERVDRVPRCAEVGRRGKRDARRRPGENERHGISLAGRREQLARPLTGTLEARFVVAGAGSHAHRVVDDEGHRHGCPARTLERQPRAMDERRRAQHGQPHDGDDARRQQRAILEPRALASLLRAGSDEAGGRKRHLLGSLAPQPMGEVRRGDEQRYREPEGREERHGQAVARRVRAPVKKAGAANCQPRGAPQNQGCAAERVSPGAPSDGPAARRGAGAARRGPAGRRGDRDAAADRRRTDGVSSRALRAGERRTCDAGGAGRADPPHDGLFHERRAGDGGPDSGSGRGLLQQRGGGDDDPDVRDSRLHVCAAVDLDADHLRRRC